MRAQNKGTKTTMIYGASVAAALLDGIAKVN